MSPLFLSEYIFSLALDEVVMDHGEDLILQLWRPMLLCFLDGPEAGMGILLGKNPRKWPLFEFEFCWLLSLKSCVLILEALQLPKMKMKAKANQTSRTSGLPQWPIFVFVCVYEREREDLGWLVFNVSFDEKKKRLERERDEQETWGNWMQNRVY